MNFSLGGNSSMDVEMNFICIYRCNVMLIMNMRSCQPFAQGSTTPNCTGFHMVCTCSIFSVCSQVLKSETLIFDVCLLQNQLVDHTMVSLWLVFRMLTTHLKASHMCLHQNSGLKLIQQQRNHVDQRLLVIDKNIFFIY